MRNHKKIGGLTHDFGSSLSSHDKTGNHIKNHKLSCDASLYSRHHKAYKVEGSPALCANKNSKYNENEMLKDYIGSKPPVASQALSQIEKNLTSYFYSADYPYNEVRSYLENNSSLPNMDTGESNQSSANKVGFQMFLI